MLYDVRNNSFISHHPKCICLPGCSLKVPKWLIPLLIIFATHQAHRFRNSFSCSLKEHMLMYLWSMWKISPASHHRMQTVRSSISIQHRPTYLSLADFSSHSVITITLRERQEMIRPSKREPCFIMGILYQTTIAHTTLFQQISQKHQPQIHIMSGSHILCFLTIYNFPLGLFVLKILLKLFFKVVFSL